MSHHKKKTHPKVKEIIHHLNDDAKKVIHKTIKNINQSIHHIIHDTDNAHSWILLAPFKRAMITVLKARGIHPPTKLDDIAKTFVARIVHRQQFEAFSVHQAAVKLGKHSARVRDNFLHLHFFEANNLTDDQSSKVGGAIATAGAIAGPATGGISLVVGQIIKAVVAWFHNKKSQKEAGAKLPADEEKAVNQNEEDTSTDEDKHSTQRESSTPDESESGYAPKVGDKRPGGQYAAKIGEERSGATSYTPNETTTPPPSTDDDDDKPKTETSIFTYVMFAIIGLVVVIMLMKL